MYGMNRNVVVSTALIRNCISYLVLIDISYEDRIQIATVENRRSTVKRSSVHKHIQ